MLPVESIVWYYRDKENDSGTVWEAQCRDGRKAMFHRVAAAAGSNILCQATLSTAFVEMRHMRRLR